MNISDLQPSPNNPRTISDEKLAMLGKAMREYGDLSGIVFNVRTGRLVGGHQRLKHLDTGWIITKKPHEDKLGTVAVGEIETPFGIWAYREVDWPAKRETAANIAANQHSGEFDLNKLRDLIIDINDEQFDVDLLGFDEGELEDIIGEKKLKDAPPRVDESKGLLDKWQVRPGDIWEIGDSLLMCGDCTNPDHVRRLIERGGAGRAVLFATDPPYLIGYDGQNRVKKGGRVCGHDWSESYGVKWDEADESCKLYLDFIGVAIREAILPNAAWYCWHASTRAKRIEEIWNHYGAFIHQQIIWVKPRPIIARSWYMWRHEPCLFGWVRGKKPPMVRRIWDRTVWGEGEIMLSDFEEFSTIWNLEGITQAERPNHPTPKPLEVFTRPMKHHTRRGDVCYEPFCGSGTQLVAARNMERKCLAIEISEEYCAVILQRMEDAFPGIGIRREG
ncbi:MAG TPA: DNA methyltransferase [Acidobacteriota bacterium]|nr:DNA methyltransferase [Acidobacteriota bacterium]